MDFVDKEIRRIDCGAVFVFTAGEQFFFHTKQFQTPRKHCKQCRARHNRSSRKPVRRVRAETRTTCAECGSETTVPFTPTQGKPVLCRPCFQKKTATS